MNNHQPPYLRSSQDWAKTLWGHMPKKELKVNLKFMRDMGRGLNDQGAWLYPDKSLFFIKDEASSDEEEIFWYIKPKDDREEFAVNYDGQCYYVILESEIPNAATGIALEPIEISESPNGSKRALVSVKALLAGYHPAACVHEYCLDNNLYN